MIYLPAGSAVAREVAGSAERSVQLQVLGGPPRLGGPSSFFRVPFAPNHTFGRKSWFGNIASLGSWMTTGVRSAASWQALQASVKWPKYSANLASSLFLMA